ncbi:MAG: hypothetical protein BWK80_60980 [Desulfobacteraceae bacterium IS3]|nr:MAG: hypothetical protein BWK80_60980 [Desulfobacteraceae bacterium IS3]
MYVKKELCILAKGGEWKSGIENLHIHSPDENIHAMCNFFTAKSAKTYPCEPCGIFAPFAVRKKLHIR